MKLSVNLQSALPIDMGKSRKRFILTLLTKTCLGSSIDQDFNVYGAQSYNKWLL